MRKLTVGETVLFHGRQTRVVATSGTDRQCIVEWFDHGTRFTSGWINQDVVFVE